MPAKPEVCIEIRRLAGGPVDRDPNAVIVFIGEVASLITLPLLPSQP